MTVWGDVLHPDSLGLYGRSLLERAKRAVLLQTGIAQWDEACDDTGGGLDDFWYVVIGGSSNVGKTQILLSLAQRALRQGFSVVFLTLEEPMDQIQRRIYASLSTELGYYDFTYDNWTSDKVKTLEGSVPYLGKLIVNDDIDDADLGSILGYLDEARDFLFGRPLVVFLDYLQLVRVDQGQSVAQAATDISEGLRRWAKKNRSLTIATSQLTAQALRDERPPRCYHLNGGSALYSNPSQVIMLDHTAKTADPREPWRLRLWGLLDKNRYGPKFRAMALEANLRTGLWRAADPDEEHLWEPNPWASGRR